MIDYEYAMHFLDDCIDKIKDFNTRQDVVQYYYIESFKIKERLLETNDETAHSELFVVKRILVEANKATTMTDLLRRLDRFYESFFHVTGQETIKCHLHTVRR